MALLKTLVSAATPKVKQPSMDVYYNQGPAVYSFQLARYNYEQGDKDAKFQHPVYGLRRFDDFINGATPQDRAAGIELGGADLFPQQAADTEAKVNQAAEIFRSKTGVKMKGDAFNTVAGHIKQGETVEQALSNLGNLNNYVKFHPDYRGSSTQSTQSGLLSNNIGPVTGETSGQQSPTGLLSKLPASVDAVLDLFQEKMVKTPINPDVEISPELTASFLKQAKDELSPYYGQLFSQAEEDLKTGFKQISEDLSSRELELGQRYGQQLQGVQEEAAQRGLAFSTKRDVAEKSLMSQTQAAIEAGRREASRRALELGTQGERLLGSGKFPTQSLPGVMTAPTPQLGQPGIYGFNRPATTQRLFTPMGGTTGTLEQQQLEAEKRRQLELTGAERGLRGAYTI